MTHRFWWILQSSCMPHTQWPMWVKLVEEWHSLHWVASWWIRLWRIQHHPPHAFPYYSSICLISSSTFPFPLPCLSWPLKVENCSRRSLLLVSQLIPHISLGRYMLTALMALLRSASGPVIPMLWDTAFLQTPRQWVHLFLCLFSSCYLSFFLITNPFFFELQPIIQE